MMFYVVNMPAELFMDGYVAYYKVQKETRKLQKDRYLRSALVLLYAALEAELNRQLKITSYPDKYHIDEKLELLLNKLRMAPTEKNGFLVEMVFKNPDSFRSVRNGITHFKGNYELYGVTEKNIKRYFQFTKAIFEKIHSSKVIAEWIDKAEKSV